MINQPLSFLMCKPEYFEVSYVINPWMEGKTGSTDQALVVEEWQKLHDTIAARARVHLMEPRQGVPDLVFTANAGLVLNKKCIVAHFKNEQRQLEEPYNKEWFDSHGYETITMEHGNYFEGAGDALFDREEGFLWAAYGQRSLQSSHPVIADFFREEKLEIVSLELVDPRYYHLDTCFCPITGGYLIYYPKAFTIASRKLIEDRVPAAKRFAVSDQDAENFACNSVDLRTGIIMNQTSQQLQNQLESWGLEVYQAPLKEFLKAGGSAKCLTLKLSEASS